MFRHGWKNGLNEPNSALSEPCGFGLFRWVWWPPCGPIVAPGCGNPEEDSRAGGRILERGAGESPLAALPPGRKLESSVFRTPDSSYPIGGRSERLERSHPEAARRVVEHDPKRVEVALGVGKFGTWKSRGCAFRRRLARRSAGAGRTGFGCWSGLPRPRTTRWCWLPLTPRPRGGSGRSNSARPRRVAPAWPHDPHRRPATTKKAPFAGLSRWAVKDSNLRPWD